MTMIETKNAIIVDKPCILTGMGMDVYHGQPCVGPSISSSGLRTLESKSPQHFYATWSGNPNAEPVSSKTLDFGRAAHALLLGDEEFEQGFAISEYDAFRSNEAKAWKAEQEEAGRTVISKADLEKIKRMAGELSRHPMVQAGILDGPSECSLFWQDEETGIWLKARPDLLPLQNWIADYKTTRDASPRWNAKSVINYGYHMQMALIAEGCAALDLIEPGAPLEFALIFQESEAPFTVTAAGVDSDLIWIGAQQNRRAIRLFAECLERGEWPGYGDGDKIYAPDWFNKKMDAERDSGLLPDPSPVFEKIKGVAA